MINHGRNNTSFDNFLVDITGCNAACSSSHPAGKKIRQFLLNRQIIFIWFLKIRKFKGVNNINNHYNMTKF